MEENNSGSSSAFCIQTILQGGTARKTTTQTTLTVTRTATPATTTATAPASEWSQKKNLNSSFMCVSQVGSSFQADIPESFAKYDDVSPYENEDILQWEPEHLDDQTVVDYYDKW